MTTAAAFFADAVAGLARRPRTLPCKYLYDEAGSALFDRICRLEAYYPTRTERALLRRVGRSIGATVGPGARIVEPGPGSGEKAVLLLSALEQPTAYLPIDVSVSFLAEAVRRVRRAHPAVAVTPVEADFTRPIDLPPAPAAGRTVVFFPGSTLGNYEPREAVALLGSFRATAGPDGRVLVGVDLVKDPGTLVRAYDDGEGVTAAFNRNLLVRLRRELGAAVEIDAFEHRARYDASHRRVELALVARRRTTIALGALRFVFEPGEAIVTEHSHKYRPMDLAHMARKAGLRLARLWTDPRGRMALAVLAGRG